MPQSKNKRETALTRKGKKKLTKAGLVSLPKEGGRKTKKS